MIEKAVDSRREEVEGRDSYNKDFIGHWGNDSRKRHNNEHRNSEIKLDDLERIMRSHTF